MAYRCDQAIIGGAREPIRCKVSSTVCAHQKMCMMEGRTVLTDRAMQCPARDGKMPEVKKTATVEAVERIPDVDAVKAPVKTRGQKPAAEKAAAAKKTTKTTGRKKG